MLPAVTTFILTRLGDRLAVDRADQPSALRDAVIGRLYGFTVVESAALDAGTALAYDSSAFVWANRAPATPMGAPSAAVIVSQGVALRQLFAFDPGILSDASIVSTFAGCSVVEEDESRRRSRSAS